MDIFAYYDCSLNAPETQPVWVPLWERSWRARGWNPRLITARHARRSKFYSKVRPQDRERVLPILALHAVGGGWLVPLNVINFSWSPPKPTKRLVVYNASGIILPALGRDLRGRFPTVYGPPPIPGLKMFSSPEEALKFDF